MRARNIISLKTNVRKNRYFCFYFSRKRGAVRKGLFLNVIKALNRNESKFKEIKDGDKDY